MKEETETIAKNALQMLTLAKKHESIPDADLAYQDAEKIIAYQAYLTGELSNLEQKYREAIVTNMQNGDSHAAAEAKAKATDEFKNWQKVKNIYELLGEQIKILKKFQGNLEKEYEQNR